MHRLAAASASLCAIGAVGAVRTETLRAFTADEMGGIVEGLG